MALERQISNAAHWSRQQYDQMFVSAGDEPPKRLAWIVEADSEMPPQGLAGESIHALGFLIAHRIDTEWELENLAVALTARRQGVGAHLLDELIADTRAERGSAIILEVRESNHAARALYRKLGFVETGLRKSYYKDPPEAATLCRLKL
jgi:ribosomal-protein-alanine N-acetyltransferase